MFTPDTRTIDSTSGYARASGGTSYNGILRFAQGPLRAQVRLPLRSEICGGFFASRREARFLLDVNQARR